MIPLSWSIETFHAQHDLTSQYRSQLRDLQKTKFTFKYEVLIVPGSHINKQASKCTLLTLFLVDKQLRDKERVESALESENVKEVISQMLASECGYASTEYHHMPENLVRSYSK